MIISVINSKGGVGKTTTALNLGEALAMLGKCVLLVDLDHQAHLSISLLSREEMTPSMTDVLSGKNQVQEAIKKTCVPGLDIVPASIGLVDIEPALKGNGTDPLHKLKAALAPVAKKYDFVLVDCHPSLGLLEGNALVASDRVLIPVTPGYYAADGLVTFLESLRELRDVAKASVRVLGILVVNLDRRKVLHRDALEIIESKFGQYLLKTSIPTNVKVEEAPSHKKPIAAYDPTSTGAQAFGLLAEEIIEKTT